MTDCTKNLTYVNKSKSFNAVGSNVYSHLHKYVFNFAFKIECIKFYFEL